MKKRGLILSIIILIMAFGVKAACDDTSVQGFGGSFDGEDDYVRLPQTNVTLPYSVMFWFKGDTNTIGHLFHRGRAGGGCVYEPSINVGDGNVSATLSGCGGAGNIGTFSVANDTLYHLALVVNTTNSSFYLNGSKMIEKPRSNYSFTWENATIAAIMTHISGTTDSYFDGYIDEFMFFNRELDSNEIDSTYQRGLQNLASNLSDAFFYYSFNYENNTFLKDDSGNGRNASMENGASRSYEDCFENASSFNTAYTTAFSLVDDIENVAAPSIGKTGAVQVRWNSNINASGADFDSYVQMDSNSVYVDSVNLDQSMNNSANVTFLSLSYQNLAGYEIYEDGQRCTHCTKLSSSPVMIEVTHFSNYSINATGIVPEFSDYLMMLALALVGGGFFVIRNQNF